ncbi:vWA domain-containing protein [Lentibacter sp. XHP0401]|jgi:uncharacterized protein|uniref:vWA domain-containing protein n=1 Tax=Lentibacter sp. XHP0401 TaxID=2984334 RepID=UPI0021E75276|nr:VWA domain-containing protein [Lentibacter sp. XHP0401]MCV2892878.1 VWA domain-containing protein [Lentibacter sp. XHP0401]
MQALPDTEGKLAENIIHFARALRKAGVNVGPAQVLSAIEAVQTAGFTRREDFYNTLKATLVCRPEQFQTFHQVFTLFWRDPEFLQKMVRSMLPLLQTMGSDAPEAKAAQRRAEDALEEGKHEAPDDMPERDVLEMDAQMSLSQTEVLRSLDFEQMSNAEQAAAVAAISKLTLPAKPVKTRRTTPSHIGRQPDVRALLRNALKSGGEFGPLPKKALRTRPLNLVVLCDISGSMATYARMMMHFLHTLVWAPHSDWGHVHGFTMGTQLTNITRALHRRDVDDALKAVGHDAPDWQGGTRLGDALHAFNRDYSRRVLGQGAVVLLITDGLETGGTEMLRKEAERLSLSCKRLVWLNPLLRFDGFAPKAAGVRTLLPLVDSFHACHNVDSLAELSKALGAPSQKSEFIAQL